MPAGDSQKQALVIVLSFFLGPTWILNNGWRSTRIHVQLHQPFYRHSMCVCVCVTTENSYQAVSLVG